MTDPTTPDPAPTDDTAVIPVTITVDQSAKLAVTMNLIRQVGLVVGFATTLLTLAKNKDIAGIIGAFQGETFLSVVGAALFLWASTASIRKTLHNEWVKRELARSAPIGQVKGE